MSTHHKTVSHAKTSALPADKTATRGYPKQAQAHTKGGAVERKGGHPTAKRPNHFVRANTKKTPVKGKSY